MLQSGYFISTGALNHFYTLRYWFEECYGQSGERRVREYHVCNLSTDRQDAIRRARERTGLGLNAEFDVRPIDKRTEVDWSVFQAGKHIGESIHEVALEDREYLVWACENLAETRGYERTIELAKALVGSELAARQLQRLEQVNAQEQKRNKIAAVAAPFAPTLADGRGGFCDSIAKDLRDGILPAGRGFDIMLDLLAKRGGGRRNSRAYDAEFERVSAIFTALKADCESVAPVIVQPAPVRHRQVAVAV